MNIYLMRHGEAEVSGNDRDRALSDQGRQDVISIANFLKPLDLEVVHFFHSDKTRAIQTASILSTVIRSRHPLIAREELDSFAPISLIFDEIANWEGDVILVGHMPFMGKLASFLAMGQEDYNFFNIEPGCLLYFQEAGYLRWQLAWMLNPRMLFLNQP